MMTSQDALLPRLIGSLERNAREIDLTFADAGRKLGEGLELFEALKQRLSGLSSEMRGPELAQAGAALAALAGELRQLDHGLSGETVALQDLATHSHAAYQALERLLEHMRLITILARSARIEAVSVSSVEHDFGNFTNEIVALTTQAQRTIQASVSDHERLNGLLATAISAQREFQRRYGSVLTALAGKLLQSLAEVSARQAKSLDLTQDAAAHSGKIALAAGGAIIALQSGDSIRQRLEHAIAALKLAAGAGQGVGPAAALSPAARAAALPVLASLQAAQLQACASELGGDADAIEAALALLAVDTAALVDLVEGVYRSDGKSSSSFLEKLEVELGQASDLLGKCDQARAQVDIVTQALKGVLETCQQTVASLAKTVSDIVLIGLNAGLRAARLGGGGRSLVVIAQELKLAADQVATDVGRLQPTFALMETASAGLMHDDALDAGHFAELDTTMKVSLDAMRQAGHRLGVTLDQLARDGSGFAGVVAQARLAFSNAGAMSDLIAGAADQLAIMARDQGPTDADTREALGLLLMKEVWPSYTMAAERTIHQTVAAACGLSDDQANTAAVTAPVAEALEEVDDFLF